MKAYWGSGSIAPLILWPRHKMEVSGQLYALAALPLGKEPPLPIWLEAGALGDLIKNKNKIFLLQWVLRKYEGERIH
jgi:hypothetical protein